MQRNSANEAPVKLFLEDGSAYPHDGRLTFSGVTVDAGTGTVTLRAVVPNPQRLLMPGMYVRAVLQEGMDEAALLVPQQAVTRSPDGSASTLVVGADNKVAKRAITVGRAVTNRWQVLAGLVAGERVLVEGSQQARVGDTVRPVEAASAPDPKLAAAPGKEAVRVAAAAPGAMGAAAPAISSSAVR